MIPPQDKSPLITKWGVARVTLKGYYYVGNRRYKKRIISDSIDESKLGYIGHWRGKYGYVYYDDKNHKHKLTSKSLDNLKTECAIRRLSWIENVQMLVF